MHDAKRKFEKSVTTILYLGPITRSNVAHCMTLRPKCVRWVALSLLCNEMTLVARSVWFRREVI